MDNIKSYVQQHKDRFINELIELLKIPSVSADPAYSQDVIDTADAVKASLEKAGCDFVEICDTPGYPIVYGEKTIDKTCLPYWFTAITTCNRQTRWICAPPPFEPVIKTTEIHPEGAIFARGSCDDKGQMYMHVKALEYMVQSNSLPCMSTMIEGEEEVGSKSLGWFVERNQENSNATSS
jgi:acetylornithine deacetylase/succinyl-diaminopimelate desuccinylase-like protein